MAKTIKGTKNADTIAVTESGITVNAGLGDDIIKVTKGNSSKIYGQAGKDKITVSSGKSHVIHGNAGNDIIRWATKQYFNYNRRQM